MEEKINIAEILKDKSEGTKLWTDMFGSVTLYVVTDACDAFQVKHHNKERNLYLSLTMECMLTECC